MITLLCSFWGAVKETFPNDWILPPTKTRLTHGVGIIALSQAMDQIAGQLQKDTYIPKDFQPALNKLKATLQLDSGYWNFGDSNIATLDIQNTSGDIKRMCNFINNKL